MIHFSIYLCIVYLCLYKNEISFNFSGVTREAHKWQQFAASFGNQMGNLFFFCCTTILLPLQFESIHMVGQS